MQYMKTKAVISIQIIIILLTAFTQSAYSFGTLAETTTSLETSETLNTRGSNNQDPTREARREELHQRRSQSGPINKPADLAEEVKSNYEEMMERINTNGQLSQQQVDSHLEALKATKSAIIGLNKQNLTKYYILTAWANYFDNETRTAQRAALRAYKTDPDFDDARATQTAISLLLDTKPAREIQKRPARQNRYDRNNPTYQTFSSSGQSNLLDLDVDNLENKLVGETVTQMKLNCLNSTVFSYFPAEDVLCVIFWKLSDEQLGSLAASSEPNSPSDNTPASSTAGYNDGYEEFQTQPQSFGMNTYQSKSPFTSNMDAVKNYFKKSGLNTNVKFLGANTDDPAAKKVVINALLENAWPWAQVMAKDPQSQATQLKSINVMHQDPLLLIIAPEDNIGKVKYAGPASGFLSPMIISKHMEKTAGESTENPLATLLKGFTQDPNSKEDIQTIETKVLPIGTQPKKTVKPIEDKLSAADKYQAGKLLENAKMLIDTGRRLPTPRRGVELCRQIIKDYPGTEYEEQARKLLRKVPKRYHRRYNITKEELGL
mgnify:CR=1 FL=1